MTTHSKLTDRSIIRLSGADVDSLLQGILTQDMALLKSQPLIYAALLTAQGKYVCDLFIHTDGEARLLDIASEQTEMFVKLLKRYRLRSDVVIDARDDLCVMADWSGDGAGATDPRHPDLGVRTVVTVSGCIAPDALDAYHSHRYQLGVLNGFYDARDSDVGMDLGLDVYSAISFTKGCYVGQEIIARMHYRHIMRKALYQVKPAVEADAELMAGDILVGQMRGSAGGYGLALCQIEKVEKAQSKGIAITANGQALTLSLPEKLANKRQNLPE